MEKLSTSQLSPLSPTRWPADAFSARRCLVFVAAVGVAFALGFVCRLRRGPAGRPGTDPVSGKNLQLTSGLLLAQIVAYIPLLAAALPLLPFAAPAHAARNRLASPRRYVTSAPALSARSRCTRRRSRRAIAKVRSACRGQAASGAAVRHDARSHAHLGAHRAGRLHRAGRRRSASFAASCSTRSCVISVSGRRRSRAG